MDNILYPTRHFRQVNKTFILKLRAMLHEVKLKNSLAIMKLVDKSVTQTMDAQKWTQINITK